MSRNRNAHHHLTSLSLHEIEQAATVIIEPGLGHLGIGWIELDQDRMPLQPIGDHAGSTGTAETIQNCSRNDRAYARDVCFTMRAGRDSKIKAMQCGHLILPVRTFCILL